MKQQTLRKIGNSIGIIIPKDMLDELNLTEGKTVYINKENNNIVISRDVTCSTVSLKTLKLAEDIIEEYKEDFKELASK